MHCFDVMRTLTSADSLLYTEIKQYKKILVASIRNTATRVADTVNGGLNAIASMFNGEQNQAYAYA